MWIATESIQLLFLLLDLLTKSTLWKVYASFWRFHTVGTNLTTVIVPADGVLLLILMLITPSQCTHQVTCSFADGSSTAGKAHEVTNKPPTASFADSKSYCHFYSETYS
jgi:hypothetical protein